MHPHYFFVPLLLLLGVVFLVVMLRRNRGRGSIGGRPDITEPPELRGPEQRKQRPF
jgi:hypothetical protein